VLHLQHRIVDLEFVSSLGLPGVRFRQCPLAQPGHEMAAREMDTIPPQAILAPV